MECEAFSSCLKVRGAVPPLSYTFLWWHHHDHHLIIIISIIVIFWMCVRPCGLLWPPAIFLPDAPYISDAFPLNLKYKKDILPGGAGQT